MNKIATEQAKDIPRHGYFDLSGIFDAIGFLGDRHDTCRELRTRIKPTKGMHSLPVNGAVKVPVNTATRP